MRIGLGCTMIEPIITHGQIDGVGFYTKHIWEELTQLNQSVTPYSFPPMVNRQAKSDLAGGKMLPLPYTASTALSLLTPNCISLYSQLENEIDIFHSTDHLVPKLKKVPVVATLHDALILKHPEWYNAKYRKLKNYIRKTTMHWADHVITISQSMVNEAIEYWGIPEHKISMVYNGIIDWWFEKISQEEKSAVLKNLNIPKDFLLVVGTLQPKKNVPNIIDAYLTLPKDIQESFPLVIVGKAGWRTEESLQAIDKLIQKKAGYWLQYISDSDLRALFQMAKAYLHPSLHEGFGLTILQAFASNTPVITSNITAMPEIAGNAALLVDPYSIESIRESILTLLTNQEKIDALNKLGEIRARQFSWKNCAEQTLSVYQKII